MAAPLRDHRSEMSRVVGLLVIATGGYVQFAGDLIDDLEGVAAADDGYVVNLFTDDPARALKASHDRIPVNVIEIPPLRWPEASLHRYKIFAAFRERIVGDVLVYLDADLRVRRNFARALRPEGWRNGMAAVRHPGFFRHHQLRPRGTWETSRASMAYVPAWRRRRYVCGGVWMGTRERVLEVSAELAQRIAVDASRGVQARWHDESHWNWWVAHNRVRLLDPRWCWVPDYPWLTRLDPYIIAVDKGADFRREATSEDVPDVDNHEQGRADDDK